MKTEQPEDDTIPRLFAWACCDCGESEKDTLPLHAHEQGKRVIRALCLDCLFTRWQRALARSYRSQGVTRL